MESCGLLGFLQTRDDGDAVGVVAVWAAGVRVEDRAPGGGAESSAA